MSGLAYEKPAYEIRYDQHAFREWLHPDARDEDHGRLKRALAVAIREELTPTQSKYLMMYYADGTTMGEIAETCGVNKSTVWRTIRRAENKLRRVLRYTSDGLMRTQAPGKRKRNRKDTGGGRC